MAAPCYKSSDYKHLRYTVLSSDDPIQEDNIEDFFIKKYIASINHQTDFIQNVFHDVYQEHLNVRDNKVSETYLAIKDVEKRTKMLLKNITQELKDYMGYDVKFFRKWEDGLMHPIRVEEIETAYNMMKKHASITDIERCLFFKFKTNGFNNKRPERPTIANNVKVSSSGCLQGLA